MTNWLKITAVAGVIALTSSAALAQQKPMPTPGAVTVAKELLAMKNVGAMYQSAVPNIIQRNKDALLQNNLNYQKDLNDVALQIAQSQNGREKEIGELMAGIYATDFTEQELKDLLTFYKTPLGQKLLTQEPRSIQASIDAMNMWAQAFSEQIDKMFRAEMRKRGKEL